MNRNVHENTNVHGGCYHCNDNSWKWGSFAAGAAIGVSTKVDGAAATRPSTTAVAAPAAGRFVTALLGSCSMVSDRRLRETASTTALIVKEQPSCNRWWSYP